MKLSIVASLALSLSHGASASEEKDTSKLFVHIPHSLYKPEGYAHKQALFGIPPYGGSIAQNVYYANSTLCDPEADTANEHWSFPFILMIDRGECSFTSKVRNAQRVGAAAVLIADTTCLCGDKDCQSDLPCEANEPIMADDGSGGDITIASMLVFKNDADLFKQEIQSNRHLRVEMSWSLPAPDDRVEYDLWTIPSEPVSRDFLINFKTVAIGLQNHAYFTPHMYIYDGSRSGCVGAGSSVECDSLCTNNGRYCATDPDGDINVGVSGADIVRESLRRLCVWEHYGERDGIGMAWWEYVENFDKTCNNPDLFNNVNCIETIFAESGIDVKLVERCMKDSGGVTDDAPNNKLDKEIADQYARGVIVVPSTYVNDVAIRGALTPNNVFSAICAGYLPGTEPRICKQCAHCPNPMDCAETGFCTNGWEHRIINHIADNQGDGISPVFFFFTMCVCMGSVVALGVFYNNRNQSRMRDQMRDLLAQYMPLEDDEELNNPMELAYDTATRPLMMSNNESYPPNEAFANPSPPQQHAI